MSYCLRKRGFECEGVRRLASGFSGGVAASHAYSPDAFSSKHNFARADPRLSCPAEVVKARRSAERSGRYPKYVALIYRTFSQR